MDADDIDALSSYLYQEKRTSKDKSKMWSLLDMSRRAFEKKTHLERVEERGTIARFLKGYTFLI
ncbi:hypothetical protein, partial [Lysinibacillus sp. D4A3_S15]|uniref:hypothetical protein n=1 Tax=Lysinibacillus sp. D4A3_S15 TaxID=2941227 RepID=UPI0020BDBCB1